MKSSIIGFPERFRRFMLASSGVMSCDNTGILSSDLSIDVRNMSLQTIADGKRNMHSDFIRFGADFKRIVKTAKKENYGGYINQAQIKKR